jgi:ABC-2 type transport system permease protein
MTHSLTVLKTYFRLGLLNVMQYRADFFLQVLGTIISFATSLIGILVIFDRTTDLKGWGRDDLIVLVGIQILVAGLINLVIRPSMQQLMEGIRLGTLDFMLTKPADSQLLASVQTVNPAGIQDVLFGTGVLITGLVLLDAAISPLDVVLFLLVLIAGLVIIYSFMLILSTCAFWFVKLDNVLVIFNTMFGNAGQWPITIYPGWLRASLTFLIPVAFAVTIPAQSLTGRLEGWTVLGTFALAIAFFTAARIFWRFALRHYTGASA